jgi:hypothetical protein
MHHVRVLVEVNIRDSCDLAQADLIELHGMLVLLQAKEFVSPSFDVLDWFIHVDNLSHVGLLRQGLVCFQS